MTPPRVSIIMNAYNGDRHLAQAIESVLAQTWHDWELVFWDDASTDRTPEIFRAYTDPRFRYFRAPVRTPLGRARIDAVARAQGAWLAFLDQDDVWVPEKLEAQLRLGEERTGAREVGMVYGRADLLHPSGRTSVHDHRHERTMLPEGDIFRSLFADSCYIAMSTVLVRADALRAVGGIPETYRYAIDYQMYLALAHRYDARALQQVCCWYRVHEGTLSRTHRAEVCSEVLGILESWRGRVEDRVLDRSIRVFQSLIAVEEFRAGAVMKGAGRLARQGSVTYTLSRPVARAWRSFRRAIRPVRWDGSDQRSE